jgi:hypothetical protein
MSRLIIGLCGPAKSGKSLSAMYLVNKYRFERVRFAEPCEAMMGALGLTYDEIGIHKDQPCALLSGKTPAHAMQTLGTGWSGELINAWVTAVSRLPAGVPVVVDDCIYTNEANAVRAFGGVLIGIRGRAAGAEANNLTPDLYVENDGTPSDLCDALDKLIVGLEPPRMRIAA